MIAATAIIGSATVAAQAATAYTPTGSTVTFAKTAGLSNITLTEIEANQMFPCSTFSMAGSVVSSGTSRSYGANGLALPSTTTGGCTNWWSAFTVTASGSWGMTVVGDTVGTVAPSRLTNVLLTVTMPQCTFSIGGVVNGTFDTATQRFTPVSGASGLTLTNIPAPTPSRPQTLCATLDFQVTDTIAVGGSWTNTGPAVGVANP
ncbi:hypothetical protein DX116_04180 [Aeromicrobium endophyticum]|uniref:Uncharacterized protein n=1 Tax=Aeromicrobium endophyticum TaxID=2292704 RepID=A0A371PB65_9ACTN|nr:hypothetical protein DX116_04180 [Aeromicrobium endophyticum]